MIGWYMAPFSCFMEMHTVVGLRFTLDRSDAAARYYAEIGARI